MFLDEFPHTITFQRPIKTPDGGGGNTVSWEDVLTTEAFICPVSSRELALAQQIKNPIDHSVFYPYVEGVKADMRIKHDVKYFTIHSSPLDQGGQGEILMVKAKLNG
jgi:SPP1 family predicted phage head-tail adaptor